MLCSDSTSGLKEFANSLLDRSIARTSEIGTSSRKPSQFSPHSVSAPFRVTAICSDPSTPVTRLSEDSDLSGSNRTVTRMKTDNCDQKKPSNSSAFKYLKHHEDPDCITQATAFLRSDHLNPEKPASIHRLTGLSADRSKLPAGPPEATSVSVHGINTCNESPVHVKQYRCLSVHEIEIDQPTSALLKDKTGTPLRKPSQFSPNSVSAPCKSVPAPSRVTAICSELSAPVTRPSEDSDSSRINRTVTRIKTDKCKQGKPSYSATLMYLKPHEDPV